MSRASILLREHAGFGLVLLIVLVSIVWLTAVPGHWRYGVGIMAMAPLVGGVLRVVLPESMLGELKVRRARWADAIVYFGTGGLMVAVIVLLHG